MYASLLHRREFPGYNIRCHNILVLQGNKKHQNLVCLLLRQPLFPYSIYSRIGRRRRQSLCLWYNRSYFAIHILDRLVLNFLHRFGFLGRNSCHSNIFYRQDNKKPIDRACQPGVVPRYLDSIASHNLYQNQDKTFLNLPGNNSLNSPTHIRSDMEFGLKYIPFHKHHHKPGYFLSNSRLHNSLHNQA